MNNPKGPSSAKLFQCPNCGAGLPVPDAATIRCMYCGSNVVVPADLRPVRAPEPFQAVEPIVIRMSSPDISTNQRAGRSLIGVILAVVIFFVVISFVAAGILAAAGVFATTKVVSDTFDVVGTAKSQVTSIIPTFFSTPLASPSQTAIPFASLVLQFGSEGTGPGQFQDARQIAVDPDGNIFVADYDTGRLQKFDPTGKFLQLVNIEVNNNDYAFVMDLSSDYAGHLYVVRAPDILIYNTSDLSLANTFPGTFPQVNYRSVTVDPANSIYAVSNGVQYTDILKLDSGGKVIWTVEGAIYNLDHRANPSVDDIAVDGLGATYLVNHVDSRVYKYDSSGKYLDRFGSKGDASGQLDNPGQIVVDPKGRVAIADNDGIDFFSADGDFLDGFPWKFSLGGIRSFTFDLQGYMYVITTSQQVVKFQLKL